MLVSLIIPTHNRARLLSELLFSIRDQRYRPVEVVVVDDASTDNTQAIVGQFGKEAGQDGGIALIGSVIAKAGAQAARNQGIKLARGEAVMFVDSDDTLLPDGIANLVEALCGAPHLDYVYGKVVATDQRLQRITGAPVFGSPFTQGSGEIAGYHWHTMGALYRRSCIDRVGMWNEQLTGSQDWEYQARVKLFGGRGTFVDTIVGYWRQHDSVRVGARGFRPDYVESVMKACASILKLAKDAGKCRSPLEKKLAKRLILHALEWGANGYRQERVRCFNQAAECVPQHCAMKGLIALLERCPLIFDRMAMAQLRFRQRRAIKAPRRVRKSGTFAHLPEK